MREGETIVLMVRCLALEWMNSTPASFEVM